MAVYVQVTELCHADAAEHGQTRFVESVREKVVATQTLDTFDQFLPSHFLKKGLGRSFRLIGYRYPVGEDELVLLVRTLPRGGNDYAAFLASLETRPEALEKQLIPDTARLVEIYADLSRTQPVAPLAAIDDEERAWLQEVFRDKPKDDDL